MGIVVDETAFLSCYDLELEGSASCLRLTGSWMPFLVEVLR